VKFLIAPLPYPKDALEPTMSSLTVDLHYEKHHKGYLEKLRGLIEGTAKGQLGLEELILTTEGDLFNNAAQVWNHHFFWRCMRPKGGGKPEGKLRDALEADFGSFDRFRTEFSAAANGEFGSGWAWLVEDATGHLRVCNSSDAENPLKQQAVPLLTLDVWEHAYYLDYRNERARYVDGFLDRLLNWDFVAANLAAARAIAEKRTTSAGCLRG